MYLYIDKTYNNVHRLLNSHRGYNILRTGPQYHYLYLSPYFLVIDSQRKFSVILSLDQKNN